MTVHHLAATTKTVSFGIFDAAIPAVLTVESGDTVVVETLSAYPDDVLPPAFVAPPALVEILGAKLPQIGPHVMTGPIAVAGAQPGDMLEVRIEAIEPGTDWGWCGIFPTLGTLPREFVQTDVSYIRVDRAGRVAELPWGPRLPLAPFFGVMGTAPAPDYGALSSKEPRSHGGNLDNKEMVAGSTLFLPVFVPGANFLVGDGHGRQGDGEVCVTALETGLTGTFRLTVRHDLHFDFPFAETATHLMSIGLDEDLDDAAKQAVREMVKHVCARTNLSRNQAYMLCSLIGDLRVTQTVDGNKGVHMLLAKSYL
jgi:acetamidase/formamidase